MKKFKTIRKTFLLTLLICFSLSGFALAATEIQLVSISITQSGQFGPFTVNMATEATLSGSNFSSSTRDLVVRGWYAEPGQTHQFSNDKRMAPGTNMLPLTLRHSKLAHWQASAYVYNAYSVGCNGIGAVSISY